MEERRQMNQLETILHSLQTADISAAARDCRLYLEETPVSGEIAMNAKLKSMGRPEGLKTVRTYCVRSYTLEPISPFVRAWGIANGLWVQPEFSPFGQHWQEVLDRGSRLHGSGIDATIIAVRAPDLVPGIELRTRFTSKDDAKSAKEALVTQMQQLISEVKTITGKPVVVLGFDIPDCLPGGLLAFQGSLGLAWVLRGANEAVADYCAWCSDVVYVDTETVIADAGRDRYSGVNWFTSKNPFSALSLRQLGQAIVRATLALIGQERKCIVVDLDNTLWGGIVGEDGPEGIRVGNEYPGSNYAWFQRWLKGMEELGFLLAINSKNDQSLVNEVLSTHPSLVLRPDNFSAVMANWDDKASNIERISKDLNIGVDTLVFIDDSPFELERVAHALPEVACARMTGDPIRTAREIMECGGLDRIRVTDEDRSRTSMYVAQSRRKGLEAASNTLDEFLQNLCMRAVVGTADAVRLERISQLTMRTNQFNLTTRRYSVEDIRRMAESQKHRVFWLEVEDKFGPSGLVGVIVVEVSGDKWTLDTFVLSCRVMGRTVEDAFLGGVARIAQKQGAAFMLGEYAPTKRNGVVRDLYRRLGFLAEASDSPDGVTRWRIPIQRAVEIRSSFVKLEYGCDC